MKLYQVLATCGMYSDYIEFTIGIASSMEAAKMMAIGFKNEPYDTLSDLVYSSGSIVVREHELDKYEVGTSEARRQCFPTDRERGTTLYNFQDDWENPGYVFTEVDE